MSAPRMLIVCPTCASAYRIDAERVGAAGRSVRCAACRETWFITPAEILDARAADAEAEAVADPVADAAWQEAAAAVRAATEDGSVAEPPPVRAALPRRTQAPKRRRSVPGLSPALALGLAALAALPLACLARASVVRAFPQAAGLYAALGLPVNLRGIEIRDVVAFRTPAEDGRPAELVVEGDLVGIARGEVPVAALAVEVRDEAGRTIRTFPVPPPRAVIGAGETARISARMPAPAQGRGVELHFADTAAPPTGVQVAAVGH